MKEFDKPPRIDEIKRRMNDPLHRGPWRKGPHGQGEAANLFSADDRPVATAFNCSWVFMEHAHDDLTWLIERVERLTEALRVIGIAAEMEHGTLQKAGIAKTVKAALLEE